MRHKHLVVPLVLGLSLTVVLLWAFGSQKPPAVAAPSAPDAGADWDGLRVGRTAETRDDLKKWASRLDSVAYWLSPFLPESSSIIQRVLRGNRIEKADILFPRMVP